MLDATEEQCSLVPPTLAETLPQETGARVEIDNRVDVGGFTDIDHNRPGAVFIFPIRLKRSPIVVSVSISPGQPDELTIRLNGARASGMLEAIVRACAVWCGVGGLVTVDISSPVAAGSGLGTSSQITAAAVAALARCAGMRQSRAELARAAFRLEARFTSCGWQDQAPLVIGGCGLITAPPAPSPAAVFPNYGCLAVADELIRELERRALLVSTGTSHFSKEILDDVKRRLDRGERSALDAWDALHGLALQARDTLMDWGHARAIVSRLAAILIANWSAELKLTDGAVATGEVSAVGRRLLGLGGYKLLGAGRGGFLFFIGDSTQATAKAAELLKDVAGWEITPWRISRHPARIRSR